MPSMSIALTKAGRAKLKCNQVLTSAEGTFSNPIPLTQERADQLESFAVTHLGHSSNPWQHSIFSSLPPLRIQAFNLSGDLESCLLAAGLRGAVKWTVSYPPVPQEQQDTAPTAAVPTCAQAEQSAPPAAAEAAANQQPQDEDYIAIVRACQLPATCNLLLIELQPHAQQLSFPERCAAAFALLSCVPVVYVAQDWCPAIDEAADSPAGRIWGVCGSYANLEGRLRGDLARGDLHKAAALREALLSDISTLVAPLRQVNKPMHFAKRGAVALVPFGVHTVNALGLVRLAQRVLQLTGMGSSKHVKKAVAREAGAGGAKVTAIDSLSDVYGLIVQGSVVAEAVSAAAGAADIAAAGAAALETISLVDVFTLGSVCFVTGMISAWGAAQCRPVTVDGMAKLIAAQQLAAAVQPSMRHVAEGTALRDSSSNNGVGSGGDIDSPDVNDNDNNNSSSSSSSSSNFVSRLRHRVRLPARQDAAAPPVLVTTSHDL